MQTLPLCVYRSELASVASHCATRREHVLQLRQAKENKTRLVPNESFHQTISDRWETLRTQTVF